MNGSSSVRPIRLCNEISTVTRRWGVYAVFLLVEVQSSSAGSTAKGRLLRNGYLVSSTAAEKLFRGPPSSPSSPRASSRRHPPSPKFTGCTRLRLPRGYDLVVVARSRAIGADYAVLEHAYLSLAESARPVDAEHAVKRVLLFLIRLYQKYLSPGLPRRCRFSPTCSQYALEAITKYGAVKGGWLALKRLLRCNPFIRETIFDPVP